MNYLLRVEGVNLSNFVFDTTNLSVARGGGLLLLESVNRVEEWLQKYKVTPKAISTGASSGLFSFKAPDDETARKVREEITDRLSKDPRLKHATFVLDVVQADDENFRRGKEELIALNRWRQMQSPTSVYPSADTSAGACPLDLVRPGIEEATIKGQTQMFSESVVRRHEYGVEGKHKFYTRQTGIQGLPKVAHDFSDIAANFGDECLNNKMAVIYLDGNDFGKIQTRYCRSKDSQKKFDATVKSYRKQFLKRLLLEAIDNKHKQDWINDVDGEQRLRFETLLWGGDEIMMVVPAWTGWWTLGTFFSDAAKWTFAPGSTSREIPLRHAAGLVFCNQKTPIHRVKSLAQALAEHAKRVDRRRNLVAYQVLESFDHTGLDLERFLQSRCPAGVFPQDLIVDGETMLDAQKAVDECIDKIPRRRLHRMVRSLFEGDSEQYEKDLKAVKAEVEGFDALEPRLERCFGKQPGMWLHLLELWDYAGTRGGNDDPSGN